MLSAGDAQAVLDGCEHLRDRLLFALLLDTGLRIGEALGLRHEDIALAERQVSVIPRPNANRVRAKSGRSREVPASAELMRLYADYLNREYGALDSDYVFVNLWGRPHGRPLTYSAVYDLVERLRRRTGIDFEPHQFRATDKDWVAVRPRVAKASRMVNGVFRLWSEQLDLIAEHGTDFDAGAMWRALETEIGPREEVETAAALLDELLPPGADETEVEMRRLLATRYNTVRPFLSLLGESSALGAASGGKRVLEGVKRLPALARRKGKVKPLLPREIDQKLVPAAWKRAVYSNPELPEGAVDRDAYVVCVLEQLYRALNRRDVFAAPSNRWSDPRARLLDGRQWEAVAEDVLHGLSLDEPVEEHLAGRVPRFGRGMAADGRAAGGGRARREAQLRDPAQRAAEAERGPPGRGGRIQVAALAAPDHRGDAPEDRPTGPAVRGRFLDRVPGRLRALGRRAHPHGESEDLPWWRCWSPRRATSVSPPLSTRTTRR